jgi:hypothetical protein
MMSIMGCLIRGTWYFILAIIVLRKKSIETHSAVCQLAGFFINLGNGISGEHPQL